MLDSVMDCLLIGSGLFQINSNQLNNGKRKTYIVLVVTFESRSHAKTMLYIGGEMSKRGYEVVCMSIPYMSRLANGFNITAIPLKTSPSNGIDKDNSNKKMEKFTDEIRQLRKKSAEQVSVATLIARVFHLIVNKVYELAVFGLLDAFEKQRPDSVICDYMGIACMNACAHLNTCHGKFKLSGNSNKMNTRENVGDFVSEF